MIHLYAVCAAAPPLSLAGVEGAALFTDGFADLVAVGSEHDAPPPATTSTALRHAEVVAAIATEVATLPVRYGSRHRDRDAMRRTLGAQRDVLREALARVGEAVEVVLRVTTREVTTSAATTPARDPRAHGPRPGRAYLEGRLAAEEARRAADDDAGRTLAAATTTLVDRALAVRDLHSRAGLERSFLVPRADADAFVAAAHRAAAELPGAVVGGPWPPYSFAGVEVAS